MARIYRSGWVFVEGSKIHFQTFRYSYTECENARWVQRRNERKDWGHDHAEIRRARLLIDT